MFLPEYVTYIIIRYIAHESHWCQIWGKIVVFISCVEDDGDDAERYHDLIQIFGFSAQVDSNVHQEDGGDIPQWTIEWFTESVLVFEKYGTKDGAHGLDKVWHITIEHVELNQPIWIDDDIIEEVG